MPVNLCVPVADGVPPQHAAFATVGAIAMHGVRRAEVQLGETACVIGLGLVGQLAVQLLVAAGVRVVGFDVIDERCRTAEKAGALACAAPDPDGIARIEATVRAATGGLGADHIFIAAGGASNDPVHIAARIARDRARVVDIGKTRLDLPWNEYYDKELDVRFSRSYGPGRYDERYELDGIDYPAGYVRWTERRNLACFIELVERGAPPDRPARLRERFRSRTRPTCTAGSPTIRSTGSASSSSTRPHDRRRGRRRRNRGTGRRRGSCAGTLGPVNRAAARRLHRRRQLRDVDAAPAPPGRRARRARPRRHRAFALGRERAAALRVPPRGDGRGNGARRRGHRRRLHRDAPSLARRSRLPRAGTAEGRVRREAARALGRAARPRARDGPENRQRPADGRLQPALRAAASPR